MVQLTCKNVISKDLTAELIYSEDPFSFVGGVNIQTGEIQDHRHSAFQQNMKGKIFAFPFGKGSSGAGLVLMEMLRVGSAPAGIINIRTDPVILTGPLIAKHFYEQILPVINLSEEDYKKLADAKSVQIFADREELVAFN
ncbi:DUF126 domain-containing protein [Rhodobacteraceae bacterium RKSG542]|uniref:aconitase X swivel domain-containing protein n=1 Tax=Pseudovibrio flavus TaxID=2529854 RepID=UPI0012BBA3C2|nr:DUF126 domain-containing protein [Pseudovibrio flavus]MTI15961.1 DUF126 domain-containing protein [Pseudovibrio flavus]